MKAGSPPRSATLLNGAWQFASTHDEAVPSAWNHLCPVPALVDCSAPFENWRTKKYYWYRTSFTILSPSPLTLLILEQAMFGTDVWLNGTYLGGDIACYTSQEYNGSDAVREGLNELIVRVGRREDLPLHSAVGNDLERSEWIPGVWGDVVLRESGNPRVKHVQTIPHIDSRTCGIRVTIENLSQTTLPCEVRSAVIEKRTRRQIGEPMSGWVSVPSKGSAVHAVEYMIPEMRLWSIEDPFLYEAETEIRVDGEAVDAASTVFGMREFTIVGSDFFFNGKRIFLRGGNIAFHRFLSDPDRGTLPWKPGWVKRALIEIPRRHNFNFFRNHIGQLYNRWYDIADEHGMLIQNEWMFWTTRGSKEQITKEFTRWIEDNCNHPSIIIWDALNECSDDVIQKEIVPAMKELDPSRPWESVDVVEEHPYIYSLGPVMNDRKFGFTRAMREIEHSSSPTMLNEFCWWWLDKENRPSSLMKDVVERWLGPAWSTEELVARQLFLVRELIELFRRMRVDAIQPFVYLSNNAGPTANWFLGDISDLQPKPIIAALKSAFAPFAVSIELWDRHFFAGEKRMIRLFLLNDEPREQKGRLVYGVRSIAGEWMTRSEARITVEASGQNILNAEFEFPLRLAEYRACAELYSEDQLVSRSDKIAFTFAHHATAAALANRRFAILGRETEIQHYCAAAAIDTVPFDPGALSACAGVIVPEGEILGREYQSHVAAITKYLESGGYVSIVEPEFGVETKTTAAITTGVHLLLEKREDADKGGYDSYVFADDEEHPLWEGIDREFLKMFNGGFGGEMVSEHHVTPDHPSKILARCGLGLKIPAVFEVPVGKGRVIVSRLQLRGRLMPSASSAGLFARRVDPVAQRYLCNLLSYGSD